MGDASGENDHGWFSRARILTIALGIATLLALYVCYLLVKPFIPALVFALALAVATHKPHEWLYRRLGNDTLVAAKNGLEWYRDALPAADSGADDNMRAAIDDALAVLGAAEGAI